ncbi:MAG: hypothetical protein IRZ28_20810 [Steroidobacteraceae bacterium]|nr:hypothetical protein [Steroidobacteraceae bacterium]
MPVRPVVRTASGRRIAAGRFDTLEDAAAWVAGFAEFGAQMVEVLNQAGNTPPPLPPGVVAVERRVAANTIRADWRARRPAVDIPDGDRMVGFGEVAELLEMTPRSLAQRLSREKSTPSRFPLPRPVRGDGVSGLWRLADVTRYRADAAERRRRGGVTVDSAGEAGG